MTRRNSEDRAIELACPCSCCRWWVEGRYNAAGEFEAFDEDALYCPECVTRGTVTDDLEVLADG